MDYDSLEDVMSELDTRMKNALNKHAPEITKTVIDQNRFLWYNEEIKEQRRVVRRREKIWKHYKLESSWKAFKKECSKYRRLLKDAKKMSIEEKVQDCKGDSKNYSSWFLNSLVQPNRSHYLNSQILQNWLMTLQTSL